MKKIRNILKTSIVFGLVAILMMQLCNVSILAKIDQELTDEQKVMYITYWDDQGVETTEMLSLVELAKNQGCTWDTLTWSSIQSIVENNTPGSLHSASGSIYVQPFDHVMYAVDDSSKDAKILPGMHVYLPLADNVQEIRVAPHKDDIFVGLGSYVEDGMTTYKLKSDNLTWGEFINDFLKAYKVSYGNLSDWYFDNNGNYEAVVKKNDPVTPEVNYSIRADKAIEPSPELMYKSYARYYNGQAVDKSVFSLVVFSSIWQSQSTYYERAGERDGVSYHEAYDLLDPNVGSYKVRAGTLFDSANVYTEFMNIDILAIPVVVEVQDATNTSNYRATIRLDEDALLTYFSEYDRVDEVTKETMKELIVNELGDSFFTIISEKDAQGNTILRAVEKAGVNEVGGVNQYGNFTIRYVPGKLTETTQRPSEVATPEKGLSSKEGKAPSTGDTTSVSSLYALLAISSVSILGFVISKKRKATQTK
ncbi:hypothetical protein EDD63_1521 [Breznakia blatticola]|uniref:Uncharacterized protein n=1 Tax=Breznakia blatticola TaxID=1754012 RepID=A0A4V3G639_9FIRM|nr:LPXTG cell wall anchor domain-containing protein [Breznakia blatticola]TDW11814.1 hypothetical protein EDD63_1521 [Breznakia blatticola]